jgi:cytochrome b involved in lipid metabolism
MTTRNKATTWIISFFILGIFAVLIYAANKVPADSSAIMNGNDTTVTDTSSPTVLPVSQSNVPVTTTNVPNPVVSTPVKTTTASGYTMAIVATHNSATSCWSVVNGKVYNLTSWINQHPGGKQAILGMCGKDGSAAFNGQHGGQARPANELASFYIGMLTN